GRAPRAGGRDALFRRNDRKRSGYGHGRHGTHRAPRLAEGASAPGGIASLVHRKNGLRAGRPRHFSDISFVTAAYAARAKGATFAGCASWMFVAVPRERHSPRQLSALRLLQRLG